MTCGGGTRSRHRRVETHALNGIACEGPLRVTEPCGLNLGHRHGVMMGR